MQTLESALISAVDDPAARPEFYRLLLDSEIFVMGTSGTEGSGVLAPGAGVSLVSLKRADGTTAIPFFSSIESLQRLLQEPTPYLAMPARSLFELTRGAMLVMNPGSDFGKEFLPAEIDMLLETGLNRVPTERQIEDATQVLLGQPAEHPGEMLAALSRLLAKHPRVSAAYLCVMQQANCEQPSLVVGLEGDGDLRATILEAGSVVADAAPPGAAVDFAAIKRGEAGIAAYMFTSVEPFYLRPQKPGWRDKMRALVGAR
jgi:hypothetical protein